MVMAASETVFLPEDNRNWNSEKHNRPVEVAKQLYSNNF
jgi:hypothetical protein